MGCRGKLPVDSRLHGMAHLLINLRPNGAIVNVVKTKKDSFAVWVVGQF